MLSFKSFGEGFEGDQVILLRVTGGGYRLCCLQVKLASLRYGPLPLATRPSATYPTRRPELRLRLRS
jgi:hypothetical protein